MKKIAWIFRSKERNEFSIETLFNCFKNHVSESEIQEYYLPRGRYNRWTFLIENCKYAKSIKADIYHITGEVYFVTPFFPKDRTILTVHDCVDLDSTKGLKKIIRWLFWYYIPFHHCKYIACISHSVCEEIERRFPFVKDKIVYAPNPIDDAYLACKKDFSAEPKILIVGTRINKNVERIIEAVKGMSCSLYIIGRLSENQKELLEKYNVKYENAYNISDTQMRKAYEKSDLICFPSTYEGFGRPIVEANAIGRPVVTSNLQPMTEVGGNAAIFVDPYDVDSIKAGLLEVINSEEIRNKLIENGYKNSQKYTADAVARIYMELYNEL